MDISVLSEKYKTEDKNGLWTKIGQVIESKSEKWDRGVDEQSQELTRLLIYEYATSLEAITQGKLSAEFVVEKLASTLGTLRFGDFKNGQDDNILYDNRMVTSESYKRLCRIDNHFGAHQVDYDEDGKHFYSVVMFDGKQEYQTEDGKIHKLSGGNINNLDDIRQTMFHEWTHVMEKCLVKASELSLSDIIKTRGDSIYINTCLSPDLTMEEYKEYIQNVEQMLATQEYVLFGGISTIEINERKSPNRRIMHNQISEGATEFISKKIMEHLGRPIEEDRYGKQADFVEKVFDSMGMDTGIATYLTSSNKIISYIESKNYDGKDILRDTDSFITALGRFEGALREMSNSSKEEFDDNFNKVRQKMMMFWNEGKEPTEEEVQRFFDEINTFVDIPHREVDYVKVMVDFALTYPRRNKEFWKEVDSMFPKMEKQITPEAKVAIENATRSCIARMGPGKVNEGMIQALLTKMYAMKSVKDVMDSLTMNVARVFGKPETKKELAECIQDILHIDPEIYNSPEDLLNQLKKNIETNYTPGNISIEENHALIEKTLKATCDKLNELGVDYYVVGALSTFIKTGTPLFRYHGDLDFMVSEADLPKVQQALAESDYIFSDDRLDNKRKYSPEVGHAQGEHEVIANHKENEFHLGFFLFRREPDESITVREYFMDEQNGVRRPKILERHLPAELAKLEYSEEPTEFAGTSFRASTPESVLSKKLYTRHPKDMLDIKALEGKVDPEKMKELEKYHSTTRVVEIDEVSRNIPKKRSEKEFPDFDD